MPIALVSAILAVQNPRTGVQLLAVTIVVGQIVHQVINCSMFLDNRNKFSITIYGAVSWNTYD